MKTTYLDKEDFDKLINDQVILKGYAVYETTECTVRKKIDNEVQRCFQHGDVLYVEKVE